MVKKYSFPVDIEAVSKKGTIIKNSFTRSRYVPILIDYGRSTSNRTTNFVSSKVYTGDIKLLSSSILKTCKDKSFLTAYEFGTKNGFGEYYMEGVGTFYYKQDRLQEFMILECFTENITRKMAIQWMLSSTNTQADAIPSTILQI